MYSIAKQAGRHKSKRNIERDSHSTPQGEIKGAPATYIYTDQINDDGDDDDDGDYILVRAHSP